MKTGWPSILPGLLLAGLFLSGCQTRHNEFLPLVDSPNNEWTTFEGKILSPQDEVIDVELSLKESSPGVPSFYRLNGIVITDQFGTIVQSQGQYQAMSLGDGSFAIRLLGAKTGYPVSSDAFFKRNIDRLRLAPSKPNEYHAADFCFVTTGDGRLALADEDFNRQSDDDRYTLFRRSGLFTVEGYLSLESDSSLSFFERNTFENWHVARLGMFAALQQKYVALATEPWEGIYIRALAYSVSDSAVSAPRGALVVKKVVAMEAN